MSRDIDVIYHEALSRGYTRDFLLARVMRFYQISLRPQRERVATRVTNSSEFGDKLKAERIAHFKRLFLPLRIFCLRPPLLFLLKPESRFRPVISLAKYSLVASQARAKSCRVATRRLFLRFCRENFNSGDFFLAIFSPVASPVRGWLHVRFSSRAGDATKNRITCASKKSLSVAAATRAIFCSRR